MLFGVVVDCGLGDAWKDGFCVGPTERGAVWSASDSIRSGAVRFFAHSVEVAVVAKDNRAEGPVAGETASSERPWLTAPTGSCGGSCNGEGFWRVVFDGSRRGDVGISVPIGGSGSIVVG
jgi:hypothetical protein